MKCYCFSSWLAAEASLLDITVIKSNFNVYYQSQSHFTTDGLPTVRFGDKPLEIHDQRFFFKRTLAVIVLM
jgi:hypothetical protein